MTLYRINLIKKVGVKEVERLENMMLASRGDEDALEQLSAIDRYEVQRKKGKVYWYEKNEEFKKRIKEIECSI